MRQDSNTARRLVFLSRVVTKELQHLLYTDAKLFISPLTVEAVASFDEKAHSFALEHMEKVLGVKLSGVSRSEIKLPTFEPAEVAI